MHPSQVFLFIQINFNIKSIEIKHCETFMNITL